MNVETKRAFSVSDKGPGIPTEMLEKVFNWFERLFHAN